MTPTPEEVARVAGKLTKAQRRSLRQPAGVFRPMCDAPSITQAAILHRLGLTEYVGYMADLTPLGTAARALLDGEG